MRGGRGRGSGRGATNHFVADYKQLPYQAADAVASAPLSSSGASSLVASDDAKHVQPIAIPALVKRRSFPSDYQQLEALMRRQIQRGWQREPHPHRIFLIYRDDTLNSHRFGRKWSYILIYGAMVGIAWASFKLSDSDVPLQQKFYPGFSDAQNKDHLFFIATATSISFFLLQVLTSGGAHYVGRKHDEEFARRANRDLVNHLIREQSLVASQEADNNVLEYAINIQLLDQHLPHYFKTLLLKNDWEAVIAIILSVAQYIIDNEIVRKLSEYQLQSANIAPSNRELPELRALRLPPGATAKDFKGTLEATLASQAMAFRTAGVGFGSGSGVSTVTIASETTRAALNSQMVEIDEIRARAERLEALYCQGTTGTAGYTFYLDPEFAQNFAALLMRECKRLMIDSAGSFRISPSKRAQVLSALLSDTYFKTKELEPLLVALINAFFAQQQEWITFNELNEDIETFIALPRAHQAIILNIPTSRHLILYQFFNTPNNDLRMRLAAQLAIFCSSADVINEIFKHIIHANQHHLRTGIPRKHYLAAALIYVLYQQGKPSYIRWMFSCGKATQTEDSRKKIHAVYTAAGLPNYMYLNNVFQNLGLSNDMGRIINNMMVGYGDVHDVHDDDADDDDDEAVVA